MSGRTIPYHLRQNKAVDRYAFIELLAKIDRFSAICNYKYIGFGGHSLEEFKYVHDRFGLEDMTSIESDEEVFKRQEFNLPYSCIKLEQKSSRDFINDYDNDKNAIIWLDYVSPKDLRNQVEEFKSLIQQSGTSDVIKITLNANASSLGEAIGATSTEIQTTRIDRLRDILGDLFPSNEISPNMMNHKEFPKVLSFVLKNVATLALSNRKSIYFQPLTCFSYSDGQQMMTLTGIILDEESSEDFFTKTGLKEWELKNTNWSTPRSINIPDLTIRERLKINQLLPDSTPEQIEKVLGFKFDDKNSLEMIKTYTMFYRQSPYFSKILV
jgi:hypothetical protein